MLVSVIVPVRNGASDLADQLDALASQRYDGTWELLLVDNGSTDRTLEVAAGFRERLPMRVVDGSAARGSAAARNLAAAAARGDLLLFCDHDDVVADLWITAMVRALEAHPAAGGALELDSLNRDLYPDMRRGVWTELPRVEGFLEYCPTANFGIRTGAFHALGGFDTAFLVAYDVDICLRLQLAGFELAFAADAVVSYRDRRSLPALVKQRFRYGYERPLLYRRHRGSGLPRTAVVPGLVDLLRLLPLAARALPSPEGRRWWLRTGAQRVGRLAGSVRYRIVYL